MWHSDHCKISIKAAIVFDYSLTYSWPKLYLGSQKLSFGLCINSQSLTIIYRGFSAYFGKRSLVILGILIDLNAQFGNFCIDNMVHFGKILRALILFNQFIFLYQYTEINTSYSPCDRQKIIAGHEVLQWCYDCRPRPVIAGPNKIWIKISTLWCVTCIPSETASLPISKHCRTLKKNILHLIPVKILLKKVYKILVLL